MADTIKVLASEVTINTTPNAISNASLVRIVNTSDSPNDVLITVAYANGTTKGTFTLGHDGTGFATLNLIKSQQTLLLLTQQTLLLLQKLFPSPIPEEST